METRDKIIDFLRSSGPIIPIKLAKELNTNILMASAFLSELVSAGKIKVSNLKIGGSPLYYIPGHEYKIQNFAINLGAKEKLVYDKLYKEKVLQDKSIEPLDRIALREMKDFAKPLQVENELYWRWYLLPDSEADELIKNNYQSQKPLTIQKDTIPEKHIPLQPIQEKEILVDVQETLEVAKEQKKEVVMPEVLIQKKETKEIREKKISASISDNIKIVNEYLAQNKIEILESKTKKSDIVYIVKIPSSIGNIPFYCRARFKKSITDADISSAFLQSQYKGLPLLFLYSGELTKKAELMVSEYNSIIIKRI